MSQNQEFKVNYHESQALLLVSITGNIRFEQLAEIQQIPKDIFEHKKIKYVVFDMSRAVDVDSRMIFSFAKIQQDIRKEGLKLRFFAISSGLRKKLFNRGVLRENETFENLSQVIKSLLSQTGRHDPIAA